MKRTTPVLAIPILLAACGHISAGLAPGKPSSPPAATPAALYTPGPSSAPPPAPTPSSAPVPVVQHLSVTCSGASSIASMVLLGGYVYEVSDPLNPRLICRIASDQADPVSVLGKPVAHLFTLDSLNYPSTLTPSTTAITLHSFGSGNESRVSTLGTEYPPGELLAWLDDGTAADVASLDKGQTQVVRIYSGGRVAQLDSYPTPIGDCVCRFGIDQQTLSFSADGQYLASGWIGAGKGGQPIQVFRVSDHSLVDTLPTTVHRPLWSRSGHRLFLVGTSGEQVWSPESGLAAVPGADPWQYLAGFSPDGNTVAYTTVADASGAGIRVNTYDLQTRQTRLLIDQPRSEVLFVKAGWVWYLEEAPCVSSCLGATMPTGRVLAMNLASGVESPVTFAAGEAPTAGYGMTSFSVRGPADLWPVG